MSINFGRALGIHEQALGFRAQRAEVLANNIANADTPNYNARDLDFATVQRLQETGSALRDALAKQDWAAIGELDLICRMVVDAAMVDSPDEEELRSGLENLLSLYRELVSVCQTEQQRVAGELVQLNQSRQGAKVYQLFG